MLPKLFKEKDHPNIYICSSNSYYDTFAGNISTGRLKIKYHSYIIFFR